MADPENGRPNKAVLVTGGTGFLGKHLCAHLAARETLSLRCLVRPGPGRTLDPGRDVPGTLARVEDIRRFVESGDCLVHLSCTTNPRTSNADIRSDLEQNLLSSVVVFEEFLKGNPGGHIVFASTGGDMYSYDPPYVPRRETDPAIPHSSYSIHKLAVENYLSLLCTLHGGRGTVLRIANPYGARVSEERGQGLVGVALTKAMRGHALQVVEPINSVRDYLHLDDLNSALDAVLNDPPSPGACETYNIGSGIGHSIGDVIATVEEVTGKALSWRLMVPSGRRATWNVLDSTKIRARFGWVPQIPFEAGVRRLWADLLRSA